MEVSSWRSPPSVCSRTSSRQPPAPCPQLALGMDRAEGGSWLAASRAHRPTVHLTHTSRVCGARNLRELTKTCKQQLLSEVWSRQKLQNSFSRERQQWQQQQLHNEKSSGPQWELDAAYMHLQLTAQHSLSFSHPKRLEDALLLAVSSSHWAPFPKQPSTALSHNLPANLLSQCCQLAGKSDRVHTSDIRLVTNSAHSIGSPWGEVCATCWLTPPELKQEDA